jgi:hypothetical protein
MAFNGSILKENIYSKKIKLPNVAEFGVEFRFDIKSERISDVCNENYKFSINLTLVINLPIFADIQVPLEGTREFLLDCKDTGGECGNIKLWIVFSATKGSDC